MSSRIFLRAALLPLALSLAGCPTPPDEGPAGPPSGMEGGGAPGPGAPGVPGDPSALPTDGGGGLTGNAPEGGGMLSPEDLKFSRFIEPGKETVTLTIHVEGADKGQIDIQSLAEKDGNTAPTVVHVEPFTSGAPVVITAPATYADALYVSAMVKVEKDGQDAPPSGPPTVDRKQIGGLADPIKLEGKNLELTVKIGTVPAWLDKLATQAAAPPPDGAGPPPNGAPGGAPGGAPPAGGAAPGGAAPGGAAGMAGAPGGPPPGGAAPAGGAAGAPAAPAAPAGTP